MEALPCANSRHKEIGEARNFLNLIMKLSHLVWLLAAKLQYYKLQAAAQVVLDLKHLRTPVLNVHALPLMDSKPGTSLMVVATASSTESYQDMEDQSGSRNV